MKLKLIFSLAIVFCSAALYAQQDPQYSQYNYNLSTINPGYVINQKGYINTGLLYRQQWTGIEGAPETVNAFINLPVNDKIELSFNYVKDEIGSPIKEKSDLFNADFAYIINLTKKAKLSFGLKTGINSFRRSSLGSNVATNPAFSENISETSLTVGAGVFLFTSKFYGGLSTINLISNKIEINNIAVTESVPQIYGIAGYVFDITNNFKLRPSTVIKHTNGAPITLDASLNALFYDKFELGASYRYDTAFAALVGFNITQNLKIGYAYDLSLSALENFNDGGHEILLRYNIDLLRFKNNYTSPRFY